MPLNAAVPLEGTDPKPAETSRYTSDAQAAESVALPPAAWYTDPENSGGMRYWDGARWTEHRTDYVATAPKPKASEGMVAAGYILAFLFPIAGVVIGAMLMGRRNRHGPWVLGLSVLFALAFLVIGNVGQFENR
jgi:hypothetical protein